jgi:glycerol uptake facilitator-like aquaporin
MSLSVRPRTDKLIEKRCGRASPNLTRILHKTVDNTGVRIVVGFVKNSREVWAGSTTAFFNEFIGTTLLIVTILATKPLIIPVSGLW